MSSLRQDKINSMPAKKGNVKPIYRLRWSFHFLDGKIKYGGWNAATNVFKDSAASLNKTNLLFAVIEGECFDGYGITKFFVCDGHDYISAKWVGTCSSGSMVGKWKQDTITLRPDIVGLCFLTRKIRVTVLINGMVISKPHKQSEKIENLREHNLV